MTKRIIFKNLKIPAVFVLIFIVFFSCTSLIVVNYYTIKTLSVNRAYISGESLYSKGQKEAVRHLIAYLFTEDENHWFTFQKEIKIPLGDAMARNAMINDEDPEIIKQGLRAGLNNEKDLDNIIWMYNSFHSVPFFKKAIDEWGKGDVLIGKLLIIGNEVHQKVQSSSLNSDIRKKLLLRISHTSDGLVKTEKNFSDSLNNNMRKIENKLVYINMFFILIIICSVAIYYSVMIQKLIQSKKETEARNENLIIANSELDKFVYSASHDLRSPITSLKGLIDIAQIEDNLQNIKEYMTLMHQSLTKQDQFISDIIDYSRNKRKRIIIESVSLDKLIDDVVSQHLLIKNKSKFIIKKQVMVDKINSDSLRLKIILNNLISNAMKFSDPKKNEKLITIRTFEKNDGYNIEVEDNGIGIKNEFQNKIFEMFFATNNNLGSGLGLYIAKEATENLNGNISVNSEINIGSTFIIKIPKSHEI